MTGHSHVRSFASNSLEYHRAFKTFLAHTDQKDKALAWLKREVETLGNRAVMIDAGAGSGKLTSWFEPYFGQVIAIEPNPSLAAELRDSCATADVLASTIAEASPSKAADFVLCSHVFYHIPEAAWESNLRALMGWLAPGGVMAIALQNPRTDCMEMVRQFIGGQFDLGHLCRVAGSVPGDHEARLETVPAHIETADLGTACEIAEFVLNVLPMPSSPRWTDLERYVEERFKQPGGRYRFSCDQDFLRIAKRS
jgi:2-polyprenyl-3-methyl-5-hydroxy-6-metoxy-1,4-benzoquinol methylase